MLRYKLRTLLIVLALGPPLLAGALLIAYICCLNGVANAPIAALMISLRLSPFWIPIAFLVYAVRYKKLNDAASLYAFLIAEFLSAAGNLFLAR